MFGSGNEPSKQWCDRYIDWIDILAIVCSALLRVGKWLFYALVAVAASLAVGVVLLVLYEMNILVITGIAVLILFVIAVIIEIYLNN
jgi:hypothetical protein